MCLNSIFYKIKGIIIHNKDYCDYGLFKTLSIHSIRKDRINIYSIH